MICDVEISEISFGWINYHMIKTLKNNHVSICQFIKKLQCRNPSLDTIVSIVVIGTRDP